MPDKSASFSIKLQADIQDIRSALDGIRGELTRLKSDFDGWSKSVTGSVNTVTSAVQKLQGELAGVQVPGGMGGVGGGGGVSYAPSVGRGVGGGGGDVIPGGLGESLGGVAAGIPGIIPIIGPLITRAFAFITGFAMRTLSDGLNLAQQYQSRLLYATGMPGSRPGYGTGVSQATGERYGMNIADWLPMVHGMRQPLAPSLNAAAGLVGYGGGGPVENLIMRLGIGTGADPNEVTAAMAQAQIGGRVQRGGMPGLAQAPGLTVAGLAGALTTMDVQDGVSRFNMTLQETVPLMHSLNAILGQHMQTYTRLNEETMKFAAFGLGILGRAGMSTQVAQNIVGGLISGMGGRGGSEAAQALRMQAVGYVPGMDPYEARLRLERGDPQDLMAIFSHIQGQYGPVHRQMAALEEVFQLQSATQAQAAWKLLTSAQMHPELMAGLGAQFEQLTATRFQPMAAVEGRATGSIELLQEIAALQNEQMRIAMQFMPLVRVIFDLQLEALRILQETVNYVSENIGRPTSVTDAVGNLVMNIVSDIFDPLHRLINPRQYTGQQTLQQGQTVPMGGLTYVLPGDDRLLSTRWTAGLRGFIRHREQTREAGISSRAMNINLVSNVLEEMAERAAANELPDPELYRRLLIYANAPTTPVSPQDYAREARMQRQGVPLNQIQGGGLQVGSGVPISGETSNSGLREVIMTLTAMTTTIARMPFGALFANIADPRNVD